jgi:hypothetical protein
VAVCVPMIITPELEISVWPSGSVVVITVATPFVGLVEAADGESVKVSPSVVRVVGKARVGKVTVFVPMMTTPELDTSVCPSGSTVVRAPPPTGGTVVPEPAVLVPQADVLIRVTLLCAGGIVGAGKEALPQARQGLQVEHGPEQYASQYAPHPPVQVGDGGPADTVITGLSRVASLAS